MSVGLTIPLHVASELYSPPRGVGGGCCLVLRAPVPEAAVDEYGDLGAREKDVSSSAGHSGERSVDPVAQASGVQLTPEEQLGLCVTCRLAGHSGGGGGEHIGGCYDRRGAGDRCGIDARRARLANLGYRAGHLAIMPRSTTSQEPDR